MKKILFIAITSATILSCSKKDEDKKICIVFSANKSYTVVTEKAPDSSVVFFGLNDTIEVGKMYTMPSFTRTSTNSEIDIIYDSIINSEFGDFGKRYRYSINYANSMPTYFYGSGALVSESSCK